jgi:hypothetical protein
MAGQGFASRQEAILAAQKDMRAVFGPDIRFEPFGPNRKIPKNFRVSDHKGHHLESFAVFQDESGNWSWVAATPRD